MSLRITTCWDESMWTRTLSTTISFSARATPCRLGFYRVRADSRSGAACVAADARATRAGDPLGLADGDG